jgi:hypothetical protein
VPGRTPCAFCIHLSRRDHDPGWPEVWRQSSWSSTPVAHGPTLSITAHTATAHVLSWVAGDDPPSMSHLVEIEAPHGKSSVRATRKHPECGCAWPTMSA